MGVLCELALQPVTMLNNYKDVLAQSFLKLRCA